MILHSYEGVQLQKSTITWDLEAVSAKSQLMKEKIAPQDEKFLEMFGWEAEPGFSVEHNQRVIAETIKKNEKLRAAKGREYDETLRERSSATAHYLKSLEQGKATDVESYFGRKYLAQLRGEQIRDKLKRLYAEKQVGNQEA